jgi:hypothetical protein
VNRMTKSVLDRALADMGAKRRSDSVTGKNEFVVSCSQPGCTETLSIVATVAPEHIPKHLTQRGWFVGKKRRYCPGHSRVARGGRPSLRLVDGDPPAAAATDHSPVATTQEPAVPPTPIKTAPPHGASVRKPSISESLKIGGLLERFFDIDEGMFTGGYSDEKIGDELNLPPAMVALVREEAFGPLKINPHIMEARAEVEALLSAMATLESEFRQKHDKLKDQALALQTRVRNLEQGRRP